MISLDKVITTAYRLTQYAHGCACKIPPGELESIVAGLTGITSPQLLVGLDDGDDAVLSSDSGPRLTDKIKFAYLAHRVVCAFVTP